MNAPGTIELVTVEDHLAGSKDLEVTRKDGVTETLRLTAPTRRASRGIEAELGQAGDLWPVTRLCLPPHTGEEVMDRLTPGSANLVEATAMFLVFGSDFQKKIEAEAEARMSALSLAVAKPSSSGPAGVAPTLSVGLGQPSASASSSPANPSSPNA